jgi:hypothetical protein
MSQSLPNPAEMQWHNIFGGGPHWQGMLPGRAIVHMAAAENLIITVMKPEDGPEDNSCGDWPVCFHNAEPAGQFNFWNSAASNCRTDHR